MQRPVLFTVLLACLGLLAPHVAAGEADSLERNRERGQALADLVRTQRPSGPTSSKGTLRIRRDDGRRLSIPVEVQVLLLDTNAWSTMYQAKFSDGRQESLIVVNRSGENPEYVLRRRSADGNVAETRPEKDSDLFRPFAGTDFWLVDLGMAFLHWPDQRWAGRETRRTRSCNVLESRNPNPVAGEYLRVLTWVDEESDGIVRAEAYDFRNRLVKEFSPGSFARVGSHYELREMEILNSQTDSRTTLQFEVDDPKKLGVKHLPGVR